MKTFLKVSLVAFSIAIITIACDTKSSLQKYYVDSKENNAFISVDLPANIIELKDENVTEEVKNTLKTIKKVNFLALQVDETNQELFDAEKEKVTEILKNPDYKQLMRMKTADGNVTVNYLSNEDGINEVIIFGSDSKRGFALVRVLGENMNPADIMSMAQEIKLDGNSQQFKQLGALLGSIK
ncbi:MAG: DUF4252 domain-containing protein [Lutibacter sp.]|nr:DUF4252 domain-containing protein [Lutibacter sp.]MDT8418335.1 DUF4252 domain-containing protein [Lutibacter sp.]